MGLRARAWLYHYSRTASEDRATVGSRAAAERCYGVPRAALRFALGYLIMPLWVGSPLWEWGMDSLFLQFNSLSSRKFCLPPGRARRKVHPIKRVAAPFYGRRSNGSQPRSTGGERTGRSPVLRTKSKRVAAPFYGRRADWAELTGAKNPVPKLRRKDRLGKVAKAGLEPATHGL